MTTAAAEAIDSTTKSLFVTLAQHSLHEWRRTGRLPDDNVRLFRSQTDLHPTQQTNVGHIMVDMWLRFQFDHLVELQDEIMLHLIRYFEDDQVHIGAVTKAFDVGIFPTLAFFPESNLVRNLPKLHRLLGEEVMRRIYEHRSIRFEELYDMFRRFPPLKESVLQAVGRVLQSKIEDERRCVDVIDPFSLPGDNIAGTNDGEPRTNVQREVAEKLRHPARIFQNQRTECQYMFARFAWDIFPKLHTFLQAGQPRRLSVCQFDGRKGTRFFTPSECRAFTTGQGRGRSASPTKRQRTEVDGQHDGVLLKRKWTEDGRFYFLTQFLIKLSILLQYFRLSRESRGALYYSTTAMASLLVIHFMCTVVVTSLQCRPIEKYWRPEVVGHCIDITAFLYSTGIFTIVTDLIMLAQPARTIWNIQRPRAQKLGLACAFLAGGLSTIASCVRLYSIKIYTESSERIRDAAPINIWSFIELNVGICCASVGGEPGRD
ncbi:hypothetical protein M409DRAFT_61553 [Zasmidium cellare ATCC 36951]|uniref:Rhodopsin domain-containing protein n=1 Tax=Zasmidium cellare ATCC 36951 TaxID=1080233 RepID=A0A6A6BUX6_ZASCE|nr:uncharacterized protein M409DRAFT_61553 [Zasmidium cellare ATCC 36951]KAF2158541.1 hypothetical protein M409DRAFT_61553 [Zasmidium cellare ATCC 36951]